MVLIWNIVFCEVKNFLQVMQSDSGGEDLGEGPRGPPPPPPPFWVKDEEMTEGLEAGRASKTNLAPSLAQGLDLSLVIRDTCTVYNSFLVSEVIWLVYSTEMKKPLPQLKQVREETCRNDGF